jgi:hypothetical protein
MGSEGAPSSPPSTHSLLTRHSNSLAGREMIMSNFFTS